MENTGVNLREVLIEEYVRKLFQLIIQEDWLLKTRNHLEKFEEKIEQKKVEKVAKVV